MNRTWVGVLGSVIKMPDKNKALIIEDSKTEESDEIFGLVPDKPLAKEVMKGLQTANEEEKPSKISKVIDSRKDYHKNFYDYQTSRNPGNWSCMMCFCGVVNNK